ncbi:hypothetical protein DESUT3_03000 [Desulfuromonas versatilis]|uniref:DUF3135 domain-containing protein n=1 Tax=Desulfuromonas versatilis TaxID=2802975 RepID=A0ABM8HNW4_9BACT|nr:DUF3135 domain-containing protein [Desulfuromonas versatilis]BCR03231.1 hypothetical protein DESUT3_03000 [Desulfuromonas versatilis]
MGTAIRGSKTDQALARLAGLYQRDPAAFEVAARELIRATIEEFPPEHRERAYGIQFQLDARLSRYRDPLVRMNVMVEIFWEQFAEFRRVLNDPLGVIAEREKSRRSAQVLPMRRGGGLS